MILVTGATGLVGGNLLWYLLQENDRITAIRRNTSNLEPLRTIFSFYTSKPDDYLNRIDWKIADVLDYNSITEAMKGCKIVYHCAAMVSLGNDGNSLANTNVIGTSNIVKAAFENKIEKLCFVSSIASCGKDENGKFIDENSNFAKPANRSLYSKSKYDSEQEVWKGIGNGLNAIIVNPGVILGVSSNDRGSSELFSQVRKGLMFYTKGGSGYVDVQDVVKIMIELTKSDISGERFILVGENCSNKEILSWMADGFKKNRPIICVGKQMLSTVAVVLEFLGKVFHFRPVIDRSTARSATNREFYSNKKIVKTLNYQFTSIRECIIDVCTFRLKN